MKYAYPVAAPDCTGDLMAMMKDFEAAFAYLAYCGYSGIELLVRDAAKIDRPALDALLERYGLTIAAIGTAPIPANDRVTLLHPDSKVRREAQHRLYDAINLGAYYNAPVLIGKFRGNTGPVFGCTLNDLKTTLKKISKEAAIRGVHLLLEPQNSDNINNLNSISQAAAFIRQIDEPNIGINADLYHMDLSEDSVLESLKAAWDMIGFFHISDTERKIPGTGGLAWREIVSEIDRNYDGFVSMEVRQSPNAEMAAKQSINHLLSVGRDIRL